MVVATAAAAASTAIVLVLVLIIIVVVLISSSSSAFPAISLGFTILGEIFAYVTVCLFVCFLSNHRCSHIRLRGWCMLGVFLLGHECQGLLSPSDGIHVCRAYTSFYTLIRKSFEGMESGPMLTPRDKSPLLEAQRRTEPATLHQAGQ